MLQFDIHIPNQKKRAALEEHLQPFESLGVLRDIALHMAIVQQTSKPEIQDPALLVFAGDHGFVKELGGQSSIWESLTPHSLLSRSVSSSLLRLRIIDAGLYAPMDNMVDFWLYRGSKFIPKKIQSGTNDITHEAAMTTSECHAAIAAGAGIVEREFYAGCNIVALSDMGMGTLESARVVNAALLDLPLIRFLPTASKNTALSRRLQRALNRHPTTGDPIMNLTLFGGYELAMLTGAILQAAQRSMTILLDGCVALTALHLAAIMHPEVVHYALIAQQSDEPIYSIISEKYRLKTIMHAGIEKRDGVGAALAFPMLRYGVNLF